MKKLVCKLDKEVNKNLDLDKEKKTLKKQLRVKEEALKSIKETR